MAGPIMCIWRIYRNLWISQDEAKRESVHPTQWKVGSELRRVDRGSYDKDQRLRDQMFALP